MQAFMVLSLAIAIGAVVFALQNPGPVTVSFFRWSFDGSLALILLATFAAGFLTSLVLSIPTILRYRLQLSAERRKSKALDPQPPKQ